MTVLLAIATFGLMMTICIHFLLVENKRLQNSDRSVAAYWQPPYATNRATSAKRQA